MTKKKIIGITAASLVLGTSIFSANASSWNSENKGKAGFGGRDSSEMTALIKAATENDYATWKALMEDSGEDRLLEVINNEEKFKRFVEAHNLRENGNFEEAEAIMQELGMARRGGMRGEGVMRGERSNGEDHEAIMVAIEAGDYVAWKNLMEERGGKILEFIDTEEEFKKFAEAKNLQKSGDYEAAKEILDALGFPFKERGFARFGAK